MYLMSDCMIRIALSTQSDSEEYQAACKLWQVYLQTRNEFVQPGEGDEDDEDGYELMDTPGISTEDEASPYYERETFFN